MNNPFDDGVVATEDDRAETVSLGSVEVEDLQEPDADLDVDSGDAEDVEEVPAEAEKPKGATKKATKAANTRPPVPAGYISPVAAAKKLSAHLTAKARAAGQLEEDEEIEVRPQVVYSYIRNNQEGKSKNPIKTYSEGGRENLLKLDEFIAWWDEKDARVAARKAGAKKTAKKAEAAPAEEVVEAEAAEVVEAE